MYIYIYIYVDLYMYMHGRGGSSVVGGPEKTGLLIYQLKLIGCCAPQACTCPLGSNRLRKSRHRVRIISHRS